MSELAGTWVALLLTLFVLSSLWRDNILSRLAEHLLIGTAAGYAGAVAVHQVLIPRLVQPLLEDPGRNWHLLIPVALALLWLMPQPNQVGIPRRLGTLGLALLFGVGAGLVVGGSWQGTLVPQALEAIRVEARTDSILLLIGTLAVPLFLHARSRGGFSTKNGLLGRLQNSNRGLIRIGSAIGQATLFGGLGVIFARAAVARLTLLIDRVQFIIQAAGDTGMVAWAQHLWDILTGPF